MDITADPSVFTQEYEDEQETRQMVNEQGVIDEAWAAYLEEIAKGKEARYVRVARQFVPLLRKIFWKGKMRNEARDILSELYLASTVPPNEIDRAFSEVDGVYQDVDGYTREPYAEQIVDTQWAKDAIEVQREIKMLDNNPWMEQIDEDVYDFIRKLDKNNIPQGQYDIQYAPRQSLEARWIEALQELGYDEKTIKLAVGSSFEVIENDELIPYDDRGVSSVPLMQEQELAIDPVDQRDYLQTFNALKKSLNELRTNFFDSQQYLWKVKKIKLGPPFTVTKDYIEAHSERIAPKYVHRKQLVMFITRHLWRYTISSHSVRDEILEYLKDPAIPPQYLALMFMSVQNDDWGISMEDAKLIPIAVGRVPADGYGLEDDATNTLYEFIELFGNELLDNAIEGVGLRSEEPTRYEIEKMTAVLEDQLLSTYDDDRIEKDPEKRKRQKSYMRGVLGAVGTDSDLTDAGFTSWRNSISPHGNLAYLEAQKRGLDVIACWRAFWNTGKVVSVSPDGLTYQTITGEKKKISFALAAWKYRQKELAANEKVREILTQKDWGRQLLKVL